MNKLCRLKGHMWYTSKREQVKRDDGFWSVPTEEQCARCGELKSL